MKLGLVPLLLALAGCGVFGPQSIAPTVDLVACIATRSAVDVEAHMTPLAVTEDVAAFCATDAGTVIATLGALKRHGAMAAGCDAGKP